ncbi:hypothetical protein ACFOYU_00200 [Microvirga sp. GCM10011540]|uniref:hypothetical protein n=1 Tax=Microvirga sp. GCM10011540 TaxID=3317338 RepID=UPI00360B4B5D
MSFHVGQVVVCVDDSGLPGPDVVTEVPKVGGVYTIREIRPDEYGDGLLLHELHNPLLQWVCGGEGEASFHNRRFRPAKMTSLEVLEAVLEPTRRLEEIQHPGDALQRKRQVLGVSATSALLVN